MPNYHIDYNDIYLDLRLHAMYIWYPGIDIDYNKMHPVVIEELEALEMAYYYGEEKRHTKEQKDEIKELITVINQQKLQLQEGEIR